MELALLLVVLCIVELVFTVWYLSKQRIYAKSAKTLSDRVDVLEKHVVRLTESISGFDDSGEALPDVSSITPDDVETANKLLAALGYKRG